MKHIDSLQYASWATSIRPTIMQKMLEKSTCKDIISFALGFPDPNCFPIDEYRHSLNHIIDKGSHIFQYAPPLLSLKQNIVKLMATRGVKCTENQIFLTDGAQQAVYLLSRLFLKQEGYLATSSQTYPGFLQVVTPFSPKIIGIPIHINSGLCLNSLEKTLADSNIKPAFFYIVSNGHNPLGFTLSDQQKQKIASLGQYYKIPTIEDDCYGFLSYEEESRPIRAYNDQWIFYVGTFSKILSPSFRTGWIIAPEEILLRLAFVKEATDINTVSFGQRIVDDLLSRNMLEAHLTFLKAHYKEKRDIMLQAIKNYFPANINISETKNGFFIWIELPENINTTCLLQKAIKENIIFLPSEEFSCNDQNKTFNGIRLSFVHCSPTLIKKGIEILGRLIMEEIINQKA